MRDQNKSQAQIIAEIINNNNFSAYTLYGGYGVTYSGQRILFSAGHIAEERRNAKGRVVLSKVTYRDGSSLVYRYDPRREKATIQVM